MEYSLSISEAAELDTRNAFLWYEDQKDDLGLRFENISPEPSKIFRKTP